MQRLLCWLGVLACCGFLTPQCVPALPEIQETDFGHRLHADGFLDAWWCEAARKVGRDRPSPVESSPLIRIQAARNEYESFQLVVRPRTNLTVRSIRIGPWTAQDGEATGDERELPVRIRLVDYVPVVSPSDRWGGAGDWPDPLLPLPGNLTLPPDLNQPFFVTVFVPADTPPGVYLATLWIEFEEAPPVLLPVRLEVFGFALPEFTHTQTAYYSDVHVDSTWHRLSTLEQRRETWDLYMQMYRQYRIAPYSPHWYAPITWSYANGQLQVDFAAFDTVMSRYLDEFGFNAFNLFGHKSPPFPNPLDGHYAYGTNWFVRFAELMDRIGHHLRLRNWMNRAYCYWADEPQGSRFYEIISGMDALRAAAPDLRRLLTFNVPPAQPYDDLLNTRVDIWTPMAHLAVSPRFTNRLALGEELWWYVAVSPTAPYPNYFIDHPAAAHRVRFWAQKAHGITGDLYYAINMWMGRNPWEVTRTWSWSPANGDGVLVYPPTRQPPTQPVIAPPTPTLRLEQVRDGLEDLEYFWLAEQWLQRATLEQGPESPATLQLQLALSNALAIVPHISRVELDPQALQERREALAYAIQSADDGRPWWVQQPVSKGAALGERCVLTAEALGWPPPQYQWFFNGAPLPNATRRQLVLEPFSPETEGEYSVVATNTRGAITSRVVRILGTWARPPDIVREPRDQIVPEGASVVLSVAAVPEEPLGYQWYRDGIALTNPGANTAALDLGRVTTDDTGQYHVVVWNSLGATTSRVASVTVFGLWSHQTPVDFTHPWAVWLGPSQPPADWILPEFDDSSWPVITAPLGFGRADLATQLDPRVDQLPHTLALRTRFHAHWSPEPVAQLRVRAADGLAVHLNGQRIFAWQAPEESEPPWGPATAPAPAETPTLAVPIPTNALQPGWNTLAVSLHRFMADDPPVAWWSFDHPDGWWQDERESHPLTVQGTGPMPGAGPDGIALTNAGSSGWLETPDAPALRASGPFTVGGWFSYGWQTGDDAASIAIEKPGEFALYYTGTRTNRYGFRVGNTEVQDPTPGTLPGQWRFVVGWYDGSHAYIQVDNGPVSAMPASPPQPGDQPVRLLRRTGPLGGFAADDVFFFNRLLAAEELEAIRRERMRSVVARQRADFHLALQLAGNAAQPPILTNAWPARIVHRAGDPLWLSLTAASAWPVAYHWLRNGTPVSAAAQPTFGWNHPTVQDSGWYSLVASNAGGSVTSPPVHLLVVQPPQLTLQPDPQNSGWRLSWTGVNPDVIGVLETSTNLTNWTEWRRWEPGTWPPSATIPLPQEGHRRFYRIRLEW